MNVDKSIFTIKDGCHSVKNEYDDSCDLELSLLGLVKEEISSEVNSTNNKFFNSLNKCINNNYIVKTEEDCTFNSLETSISSFKKEPDALNSYDMFQSDNNVLRDEFSDKLQLEIEYDDKIIKIEKEVYEDCVFESEIVIEKNSIDKMLYEENINDINNIECAVLPKPIFNKLDKLDYYSNEVIKNKSNRENVYVCSFCHNCFSSQKSLIFHINQTEHHISNNVSKKSCLDSIKFKPIKKITLKKKSFECEICLKHFSDYSNCRRHIRNHTSINKFKILEEFKCLICMKTFSSKYSLQVHNRIHTGETPYKCDICQLTFNRNDAMLLHRKNHGEEYLTIIHCNKCEKSFHTNSSFSHHQRLHKNEKRFSCTYCQKSYTRKDSLITHIRSKHTSEKPYQCNICKKSFFEKCVLERHKKSHQKKEIK